MPAFCLLVLLAYALRQADPDLWGHVLYGRLWLTQGIVATDLYSYTAGDHPWIGHEVGTEIIWWLAYAWAGQLGLSLLKTACGVAAGLIMWWSLPRHRRSSWLGLVTWLAAMHVVSLYLLVRPQLFTFIFAALSSAILFQNARKPTRRVWLIPLICPLWTTLHGGYVVLLGLVGLYFAGPWLHWIVVRMLKGETDTVRRPPLTLFCVLLLSATLTTVNPYGPKIWICLVKTFENPYTKYVLTEWRGVDWLHPTRQEMLYILFAAGLVLCAATGISWRGILDADPRRRVDATGVIVCAATTLLPVQSYRHIPLLAIVAAPWMLLWGTRAWRRLAQRNAPRARLFAPFVLVAALGPMLTTVWYVVRDPRPRLAHLLKMPVGAVRYIQENRLSGNIYNPFAWGHYLSFHLYPQCRVGMDGRYDTVYPRDEYVANFRFEIQGDTDRSVMPPTDFVLTAVASRADASMARRADWRPLYQDNVSTLWARADDSSPPARYRLKTDHTPVSERFFP